MCVLYNTAIKKEMRVSRPTGDLLTALKNIKETNLNAIPHGWIWKFALICCWHK